MAQRRHPCRADIHTTEVEQLTSQKLAAGRGAGVRFLVVAPDWTSPPSLPHSRQLTLETFDSLVAGDLGFREAASFPASSMFGIELQHYGIVNPPVRVFERRE